MFGKCLICFAMCLVTCYVKAAGKGAYSGREDTCLSKGGICVQEGDCPKRNLEKTPGLCPSKPNHRLECCYGLPISAEGCSAQGGECFEISYRCATETRANDCDAGEHCCILVT